MLPREVMTRSFDNAWPMPKNYGDCARLEEGMEKRITIEVETKVVLLLEGSNLHLPRGQRMEKRSTTRKVEEEGMAKT